MKLEIDKSQEKQKRNRQTSIKQVSKSANPQPHAVLPTVGATPAGPAGPAGPTSDPVPVSSNPPLSESKQAKPDPASHVPGLEEAKHANNETHPQAKSDGGENKPDERRQAGEAKVKESDKSSFKVETEEREIEVYKNPESPRPAPPVFDENLEAEAIYNKSERKAKEREAVEHAQKVAHEQKMKVEQELGEKKNELNQLEGKYENIAAKYMNKK